MTFWNGVQPRPKSVLQHPRPSVACSLEASNGLLDHVEVAEVVEGECFSLDDGEVDLDLMGQDTWTGVCTVTAVGNRSPSRSMAFCPRRDWPLWTTQNTRSVEAYGSWVMT